MKDSTKNIILYSNEITDLIQQKKIECIFLGGSSLEKLESSESDYNVIVITSDEYYNTVYKEDLFSSYKWLRFPKTVQITICNLSHLFNLIHRSPSSYNRYAYEQIKYLLLLKEEDILFASKKFKNFYREIQKFKEPLGAFCLESSLHASKDLLLNDLLLHYNKNIYNFYKALYYWNNFLNTNDIFLTEEQKRFLINLKETKKIPKNIQNSLRKIFPYFSQTKRYNHYSLREELLELWERKFI